MPEFSETNQPERRGDQTEAGKARGRKGAMTSALVVALNRETDEIVDGKPTKKLAQIVRQLVNKAGDGDLQAIKEVFDRIDGKAMQALELSGLDGKPIDHKWTFEIVNAKPPAS